MSCCDLQRRPLGQKEVKAVLGVKVEMPPSEEATTYWAATRRGMAVRAGYTVSVYFDVALKASEEVVPAAGSPRAAVHINRIRFAKLADAQWLVCVS